MAGLFFVTLWHLTIFNDIDDLRQTLLPRWLLELFTAAKVRPATKYNRGIAWSLRACEHHNFSCEQWALKFRKSNWRAASTLKKFPLVAILFYNLTSHVFIEVCLGICSAENAYNGIFRDAKFQNFPEGACPQSPLESLRHFLLLLLGVRRCAFNWTR